MARADVLVDLSADPVVASSFAGGADAERRFEIASLTKALTGMLLADGIDRGELSLDTRVGEVLGSGFASGGEIGSLTVRELCTHTSGLPLLGDGADRVPRAFPRSLLGRDPHRGISPEKLMARAASAAISYRGDYRYSNLGAALLGQMLVASAGVGSGGSGVDGLDGSGSGSDGSGLDGSGLDGSGSMTDGAGLDGSGSGRAGDRSFDGLLAQRVLAPLGMTSTSVSRRGVTAPRGHAGTGRARAPWIPGAYSPAGGLISTPADMARLVVALLDGSAPGLGSLTAIPDVATASPWRAAGMFWSIQRASREVRAPYVFHAGQSGGYGAFLALWPADGRGVVVLTDVADADAAQRRALELVA